MEKNGAVDYFDLTFSNIQNKHKLAILSQIFHTDITISNTSFQLYEQKFVALIMIILEICTIENKVIKMLIILIKFVL